MKTIKRYILIAFSALTLPACTLLDTEPQDFITPDKFYNTQEELEAALRGVYMTLADNGLYGMNIPARLGLSADIGYETYDYDRPAWDSTTCRPTTRWYSPIGACAMPAQPGE